MRNASQEGEDMDLQANKEMNELAEKVGKAEKKAKKKEEKKKE